MHGSHPRPRRGTGDHRRARRGRGGSASTRRNTLGSSVRLARWPSATYRLPSPNVGMSERPPCPRRSRSRLAPGSRSSRPAASGVSIVAPRSPATSARISTRSPVIPSSRSARGRRPSSTCRGRSNTSRPPACRSSAGATTSSRRSTRRRPDSLWPIGWKPRRRSPPCSRTGPANGRGSSSGFRSRPRMRSIPTSSTVSCRRPSPTVPPPAITGAAVTPFVLGRIAEATAGRSVPANLALAENNAGVAAEIALALTAST